jgi:glycosyltransferase involved in cell wall biosynthesis
MTLASNKLRPLVTIIIPTFKNVTLLRKAINSVLVQSYTNWELLIVDNFSKDGTEELVSKFQHQNINKIIRFYKVANNGIIARSRNLGINNARGHWIAFLDSDDWWEPDKLKISLEEAEYHNADLIYHDLFVASQNSRSICKKKLRSHSINKPIFTNLLSNGNVIFNSSVVVKRSILNKINNLDESEKKVTWEDYDCWLRTSLITDKFHYISRPLGWYWIGSGNTSNPSRTITNLLEIFDIYIKNTFEAKPFWFLYSMGSNFLKLRFYRDALKYFNEVKVSKVSGIFLIKFIFRYHHAWIGSKLSKLTYKNSKIE